MPLARPQPVDAVVYPSTDHMGEHELQRAISELLRALLVRVLSERGERAHVGANTFLYWVEGDPSRSIAPDVYVLPGVAPGLEVPCWKLWEPGVQPPSFALEVVSGDWKKDYEDAPRAYAALGCAELVLFDPHATPRSRKRVRWQHYRRDARGALRRVPVRAADRVRVASLGLWLREVRDEHDRVRLRVATDDLGNLLVPTDAEARRRAEREREQERSERERAEQEREREAAARAAAEVERERAEREREQAAAAREAAEEELARLRAELAALRSEGATSTRGKRT